MPDLDSPEALLGLCAAAMLLIGVAILVAAPALRQSLSESSAQFMNRLGTELVFMALVVFPVGLLFLIFNPDRKWEIARGLAVIVPIWGAMRIYRIWRPRVEKPEPAPRDQPGRS